ncbi:MAG: diacylglycerol/lipid kinase family protein [Microbacterium sp.]
MTDQVAIVWNPSKTSREELDSALAAARKSTGSEAEVSWFETSRDDPGRGAAERAIADGADVVIAAGGDGTVRAVAEAVAGAEGVELAVAPLGTGNLLARNLQIPLADLAAALTRALGEKGSPIDIGWIRADEGEWNAFAVMAGFGIDAHMITETDDDLKDRVGWLAYVESLGRAVSSSEVIDIRMALDGEPLTEARAHTLMVGNCGTVQGGITLLPDADPRDGELDVLALGAENLGGWLDTMRNMLWDNGVRRYLPGGSDRAESSASAAHHRATRVRVELDEPRVIEIDGDTLGEASTVEIELQPEALRVR